MSETRNWRCSAPVELFKGTWGELEDNHPELAAAVPSYGLPCDAGGVVGRWCARGVGRDCQFLSRGATQPSAWSCRSAYPPS